MESETNQLGLRTGSHQRLQNGFSIGENTVVSVSFETKHHPELGRERAKESLRKRSDICKRNTPTSGNRIST